MLSRRSAIRAATIVAGAYAIFAGAWIVLSDRAVLLFFGSDALTDIQTFKGLIFVAVTAAMLFFTVRLLVTRAASALERELDARRRLDRLHRLLADANEHIVRAGREEEMLQAICDVAVSPGGFSGAWVGALGPDGRISVLTSCQANSVAGLDAAAAEACGDEACPVKAIFAGAGQVVDNDLLASATSPGLRAAVRAGVRSFAAVPVVREGRTVAAFCVFAEHTDAFAPAEMLLLQQLGTDLSIGLERISAENTRRESSARLEESERRYRDLFSSAPRPMFVYDLETTLFLDVNDAFVVEYGYSRDELRSMKIADIHPPEDIERLLANISHVGDGLDRAGVWRHVTRAGREIVVDITSHVIDWEGRRAEVVLIEDITGIIEATESRERALARFSALIETSPAPIMAVDSSSNVTLWNSAAEQIFGWNGYEVVGKPSPILSDEERSRLLEILHGLDAGDRTASFQAKLRTKDGKVLDVVVSAAPLVSENGEAEEYVTILIDVTERVRTEAELERHHQRLEHMVDERTRALELLNEELREATRVKSEFLASMSHELRTPLNSIIGFSGVLLQGLAGELNREQEVQIEMIRRSGQHLLALINDVLDVSKIEAGQVDIRPEEFYMDELATEVLDALRPYADEKGLALTSETRSEHVRVVADPLKVQQILFNLVGNAIKFTDEGSVTVHVSAAEDVAEVSVVDTGPGVPFDEQESVFDEFRQAGRGRVTSGGTGLGLTISRRLARMMGGEVSLFSSPGEGATFTLTLPLVAKDTDSD